MGKKFYYHNNKSGHTDNSQDKLTATTMYNADKLNLSIDELGFSDYSKTVLANGKISTAADLVRRTERDMFKIQGLNKRVLNEVKALLEQNGMTLRDPAPQTENQGNQQPSAQHNNGTPNARKASAENKAERGETGRAEGRSEAWADGGRRVSTGINNKQNERSNERTNNNRNPVKRPIAAPERPQKLTEPLPVDEWRKIQKGGKWGFYDGFKTVIPAMYDEVFCFKDGLASVELDEKCGYIDSENNIIIPFEYETAMSFSEGLASVVKGTKCGYINKENDVVIPFDYDAATKFEGGEAKVKKDGRWGTITVENKITWI